MKEQKREIKNKILSFEKKFYEENKRKIKFKGDIIGYEDLYQQYFVYLFSLFQFISIIGSEEENNRRNR